MKTRKLLTGAAVLATACMATSTTTHAANILGITVSSYDGSLSQSNWNTIASSNIDFAFVRATTGYEFSEDTDYSNNMKRGKKAGLLMGAYEFSHLYADTPSEEATYFWNYAGSQIINDGKSISPMIDFEVFSGHDGASSYTAWFNDWAKDLEAKTTNSMTPVIYASTCAGMCDLTTSCTLGEFAASFNGENIYTGNPWNACTDCNYADPGTQDGWIYWDTGDTIMFNGISDSFELIACIYTSKTQLEDHEGVGE